jgi:hypothetical protein
MRVQRGSHGAVTVLSRVTNAWCAKAGRYSRRVKLSARVNNLRRSNAENIHAFDDTESDLVRHPAWHKQVVTGGLSGRLAVDTAQQHHRKLRWPAKFDALRWAVPIATSPRSGHRSFRAYPNEIDRFAGLSGNLDTLAKKATGLLRKCQSEVNFPGLRSDASWKCANRRLLKAQVRCPGNGPSGQRGNLSESSSSGYRAARAYA